MDYISISGTLQVVPDACEGIINACSAPYDVSGKFYNATYKKSRFFRDLQDIVIDIEEGECVMLQVIRTLERTCMVIISERRLDVIDVELYYKFIKSITRYPCNEQTIRFFKTDRSYFQEVLMPRYIHYDDSFRTARFRYVQYMSNNEIENAKCRSHTYTYRVRVVLYKLTKCAVYDMRSAVTGADIADHNVCGVIHVKEIAQFRIWILEEFDDFSTVNKNCDVMQISNVMYINVAYHDSETFITYPICKHLRLYIELTITKLQEFNGPQTRLPKVIHFWSYYRLARPMYIRESTPIQLECAWSFDSLPCFKHLVISYSKVVLSYIVPIYSSQCPDGMLKVK